MSGESQNKNKSGLNTQTVNVGNNQPLVNKNNKANKKSGLPNTPPMHSAFT